MQGRPPAEKLPPNGKEVRMNSQSRRRRLTMFVVLALGAAVLTAGLALARAKYPSEITVFAKPGTHSTTFSGEVSSEKAKCVKGRSVSIYRAEGDEPGEHDHPAGHHTTTDTDGAYETDGPKSHPGDKYYAVVEKHKFGRKGHKKTCLADTSPLFEVD